MSINSHIQSIMFYDLLIALLFNLVFHHILTVIETYCSSLTSVVCACNICNLCIQYALAQQMVCYPFLCCTEFLFQILMNLYKILWSSIEIPFPFRLCYSRWLVHSPKVSYTFDKISEDSVGFTNIRSYTHPCHGSKEVHCSFLQGTQTNNKTYKQPLAHQKNGQ